MDDLPEFRCTTCGTYHEPPKCTWPVDAPCRVCARPIGFRGDGQSDDGRCNRCWCAQDLGIVVRDSVVPEVPAADWLEGVA